MSHSKSDTKSELQALQDKCRIELFTNLHLYQLDIRQLREVVNDANQIKQWLAVSSLMDTKNLMLHIMACCRRLAVSELHPTGGKDRTRAMKRIFKQAYIQSLSSSPAIAHVHLHSADPNIQGIIINVIYIYIYITDTLELGGHSP